MTDHREVIGIDTGGDRIHIARVDLGSGRPQVKALARFEDLPISEHHLLHDGQWRLAIPDDCALVKRLHIVPYGGISPTDLAAFEMMSSLLDDSDEFLIQTIDTGRIDRSLGIAIRRTVAASLLSDALGTPAANTNHIECTVRAAALGNAYLGFCRRQGTGLVALVDWSGQVASICLLYDDRIADLAQVDLRSVGASSERRIGAAVAQIQTVLNFRAAALAEDGIGVPLSRLVVSGDRCDQELRDRLAQSLDRPVDLPEVSPAYFPDQLDLDRLPLAQYLVALGAAVSEVTSIDQVKAGPEATAT